MNAKELTLEMPGVVVMTDFYPPAVRSGGPARSVPGVVRAESLVTRVTVLSRCRDHGCPEPFSAAEMLAADRAMPSVRVYRFGGLNQPWQLCSAMRGLVEPADLIYLNSLLSPQFSVWPVLLMNIGAIDRRRVLLAPRGELSAGALGVKPLKKRFALPVIRRLLTRLDVVWQATSDREAQDIRSFLGGSHQPIVIRPNPPPPPRPPSDPSNTRMVIAFVGRMVPLKNFHRLAEAACRINFDMEIKVVGILEDNAYWKACKRAADRLPQNVRLVLTGHLEHEEVIDVLRRADAMALPTRGENFGHAIAEALSVGCPVMIPDTTMWTQVIQGGGGWIVDADDPGPLTDAFLQLHRMTPRDRHEARVRAARLYAEWWTGQQQKNSLFLEAIATR